MEEKKEIEMLDRDTSKDLSFGFCSPLKNLEGLTGREVAAMPTSGLLCLTMM